MTAPVKAADLVTRSITNTATLSWTEGGLNRSLLSNKVDLSFLATPRVSYVFDSRDGSPVTGVRITLINVATGQPAIVFGLDGTSRFPSTLTTGQSTSDTSGYVYSYPAGAFSFPWVSAGTYRLQVEAPAPFSFGSSRTQAELSNLHRPDNANFQLASASFGGTFTLQSAGTVTLDVPLDRPAPRLLLSKVANRSEAEIGDLVRYELKVINPESRSTGIVTVKDYLPAQMRYRPRSARLDGARTAEPTYDGRTLTFQLASLGAAAQTRLSYVLEVRPDARAGDALNRATASVDAVDSNVADALVRVTRDRNSERLTIVGRVFSGCVNAEREKGVPGVRVMLEDGSYAVSDHEGRFHFEGVSRGTHVVQLDRGSLPAGVTALECASSVRSGGRGSSRWVEGRGGDLKRVDFHLSASPSISEKPQLTEASASHPDRVLTGSVDADRDWFTGQQPGVAFLYPTGGTNPRAPVTRVVVKHRPGQTVKLLAGGKLVAPVSYDGTKKDAAGVVAISSWRGIPLQARTTELSAEVRGNDGKLVETLRQTVIFSDVPARVEVVREKSLLLADGIHRPRIALRFTDRGGRPIHHGVAGDFQLPEPYVAAMEAGAQQARQLAGLERARPTWHIDGDEGLAFVELEPTTASGSVSLRFPFRDGTSRIEQRVDFWLSPGDRPWTIVGLAEGTIGFDSLKKNLEKIGPDSSNDIVDGRLAFYAKGRVLGRWLMTLSYDNEKDRDQARLAGVIDPQNYYTIYADRSERRYDAASVRKFYVRLERPQFLALFGDYETGIDEPVLGRYVRSLNGAKAEFRSSRVSATAFAAANASNHHRDEIQGNGLSGPYALSRRRIVANSDRIMIEVRDRFRSEKIVEQRLLSRHVDYDIDYLNGTVRFREPILSRSSGLDPQFVVADYEVDGVGSEGLSAGGRVAWQSKQQAVRIGVTAIQDDDGRHSTSLAALDARVRLTGATEVRAEFAATRSDDIGKTASAWLVEAQHRNGRVEALAYAGEREIGFGLGQTNSVESGTRKYGLDARFHLSDVVTLSGSAWRQEMLATDASRTATRLLGEYRSGNSNGRFGLVLARDELSNGADASSTLLTIGGTTRLVGGRLELGADSEIPLGSTGTIDFPSRHRLSGRYAVNRWASLIGTYEITNGPVDARTARLGVDLAPWAGARIALSGNVQNIDEYGPRSFAALGLAQSVILSSRWSVDLTLDSNRTVSGIDPSRVVNPLHPVASGGFIGGGRLTEDFTAVTAGATYRAGPFSATGRAELRDGDRERRTGVIFGVLRQIGNGRALGGSAEWYNSELVNGALTSVSSAQLTWANRPSASNISFLNKLAFRRDAVKNAVAGYPDALGQEHLFDGHLSSVRLKNSLTLNYSNRRSDLELSAFWGLRYVSDSYGSDDAEGWSNLISLDGRIGLSRSVEVGASASVRQGLNARSLRMSAGPQMGFKPITNGWLVLGYNVVGYRDRDFADERFTRSGPYASFRFKFDEMTLASLLREGSR
ncbi:hypothetical protein ACFQPG_10890 [Sphingomonas sp. GCM10030256]|uniref:hypothetical protein n=1 Tax=Sphingomonas sp. GCM10030256 TaxID=3273427 RepID=UPI00360F7196